MLQSTIDSLFAVLAATALKSTALAALALLVWALLKNASAASRHLIVRTGLSGLLLLPLLSLALPAWEVAIPMLPAHRELKSPLPNGNPPGYRTAKQSSVADDDGELGYGDSPFAQSVVARSNPPFWSRLGASPGAALAFLWLAGVFLAAGRFLLGWGQALRIARSAAVADDPRTLAALGQTCRRLDMAMPPLRRSSAIHVPILAGLFRPALLLPASARDWAPERLRLVFLHELAHLKRRDNLTHFLGRLTAALYWFHPLVWALERIGRRECEKACDDVVLSQDTRASDYARQLLGIARALNRKPLQEGAILAMARRSNIEKRLEAILHPRLRRREPSRSFAQLALWTALAVVLSVSTVQFTFTQDPVNEPQERQMRREREKERLAQHQMGERLEEPRDGEGWFDRGWEFHRQDRFDEAVAAFQRAAEMGHRKATSLYNVACGYAMQDNADQALLYLEQALAEGFGRFDLIWKDADLDPIRPDARFQALMDRYAPEGERHLDRLGAALGEFDRLQSEGSSNGREWKSIGLDLLRLRQLDRAAVALTRAVDLLADGYSTPMYNLACAYALSGDGSQALTWLDRAVDSGLNQLDKLAYDPDLASIRGEPAFAQIQAKAQDLSLDQFRRWDGEEKDSRSAEEKWAPAIAFYSEYVLANPQSGRAWGNLAYAQHYSGRHADAVGNWARALELGYRPAAMTYNLACAYARMNQRDAAFQYLSRAENAGFDVVGYINDDDLDNLRSDPRFERYEAMAAERRQLREEKKAREKAERKARKKERNQ